MKTYKRLLWFLIIVCAVGMTGVVLAQVSSNFNLEWHVLSGGGGDTRFSSRQRERGNISRLILELGINFLQTFLGLQRPFILVSIRLPTGPHQTVY